MEYRVVLEPDTNDTILATFPDLPGTQSFGDDEASALAHAQDAMVSMLEFLIRERRPIPLPRRGTGPRVTAPALLAAKVYLHNAMLEQKVSKAELGRRLDQHTMQIDRLVDVRHASKLEQLEAAFAALGQRLEIIATAITTTTAPDATRRPHATARRQAAGRAQKRTQPPHARAR